MIATTEDHLFWNLTDRVRQEVQAFDDGDQLLTADGDTVLAFDADDGSWAPQAVLHQWSYLDTDEMATLRLTDGSTVTATDHHRFWSSSSRTFQEAEQLTLGDQLVTPQGEVLVDAVVVWPSAPTLVWELTVAGLHTFAAFAGDNAIAVHNEACGPDGPGPSESVGPKWRGTNMSAENSFAYHFGKHGAGRTAEQYAKDAAALPPNPAARQRTSSSRWEQWN